MIYIVYTYISLITYTCVKTHSETRSAEASAADLENFQECQRQATGFCQIRAEMCERRRRLVGVRGTATISTEHSSATPDCWVSQWGHQCMPLWHLSPVQEVCLSLREKRPAKWTVHVFVLWRLGRRTRSENNALKTFTKMCFFALSVGSKSESQSSTVLETLPTVCSFDCINARISNSLLYIYIYISCV